MLQEEEENHCPQLKLAAREGTESDTTVALLLQQQENEASREAEEQEMTQSSSGKAVVAVQRIIQLVQQVQNVYPPTLASQIEAVAIDDMVFLAEKLLAQQHEFCKNNIPSHIDIGYHYTNGNNIAAIRTSGLLTKGERANQNMQAARSNGSVFGDGIYTANNPLSFSNYGEVGLLVGRLQGDTVRVPRSLNIRRAGDIVANTIVGDKLGSSGQLDSDGWPMTDRYHEIVLRSSSQCLPMVKYDRSMLHQPQGKKCIQYLQTSLQEILDELFNKGSKRATLGNIIGSANASGGNGVPTTWMAPTMAFGMPFSSSSSSVGAAMMGIPSGPAVKANNPQSSTSQEAAISLIGAAAPHGSVGAHNMASPHFGCASGTTTNNSKRRANCTLRYEAPKSLMKGIPPDALILYPPTYNNLLNEDCVICQDKLSSSSPCAGLNVCKHVFHHSCVQHALESKPQCPVCRKSVGAPKGKSPSGTMSISVRSHIQCSGYYNTDSIVISYVIRGGVQESYHDNPGQRQPGKRAAAYLPNNADGQNLLKRLKYAFLHGLTFTVGTSATTGRANQCTWSSIHHKTSPSGGITSHGFPDPSYFLNCNEELDGLGVPPAHVLTLDGGDI